VTEEPVTEEPATEAPATEAPVTEEPATEAPATLESQPPSVDPASPPEQALASGGFRYAIAGASRGETIADLPDLAATGTGEWVVLSMTGQNASDTEQVFDMSQFQLYADGKEVQLDVGNAWVSGLLGFTPAYGNTDAILWAADEGHPFALTFLVPTGAQQLTLVAGDQAIDLGSALANQAPLAQDTTEASKPEYIEATVVDVIDAETIVIEKDGIQQTVRYLGIDVPTGDDCYASEAAEANRRLVEGKTVRLERQATDVDAQGNWVRDVWTPAEDGRYFLVSESLVSDGAATAGISEPNTRYAGWLLGSQSVAKAEERGLWGSCGEEDNAQVSAELEAILPATARVTNYRRAHR
jgi:micrococcal nuclease